VVVAAAGADETDRTASTSSRLAPAWLWVLDCARPVHLSTSGWRQPGFAPLADDHAVDRCLADPQHLGNRSPETDTSSRMISPTERGMCTLPPVRQVVGIRPVRRSRAAARGRCCHSCRSSCCFSRRMRCTVPEPTPTSRATLRMPLPAAQPGPDRPLRRDVHLRSAKPKLRAFRQPDLAAFGARPCETGVDALLDHRPLKLTGQKGNIEYCRMSPRGSA
jgi:hypothetical protein